MGEDKLMKLAHLVHRVLPNFQGIGRKEELIKGFLNSTFTTLADVLALEKSASYMDILGIEIVEKTITIPVFAEQAEITFMFRNKSWKTVSVKNPER